jgi:hypothetical protein
LRTPGSSTTNTVGSAIAHSPVSRSLVGQGELDAHLGALAGGVATSHRRPCCASMIERHMAKPMPTPCIFVPKNGSKRRSVASADKPGPVSRTVTSAVPALPRDVRTESSRRVATSHIASIAFWKRLSSTCSSSMRSVAHQQ